MKVALTVGLWFWGMIALAQQGVITGEITGQPSSEPVGFAEVRLLEDSARAAISDIDGKFRIEGLAPGLYSIRISATGFEPSTQTEIMVSNSRVAVVNVTLKEKTQELGDVEVKANAFELKTESPVGYQTLGRAEIERYPGGNRDVSKVIRALPGVASPAGFRNDIIIRGGAPGENRFYLDGIEVPTINHFATQGSSGGPVGLLNVNFIREVEFYSGAFPANRGNTLSSVFEFQQKEGNPERLIAGIAVGSSDLALNLDGPLGKKADIIFSVRRSYLQFLFAALRLPFLPTYNDGQFRVGVKINQKNRLTFIGLGAIDQFRLNTKVNDGVTDSATLARNRYILGNLPSQEQWNYTVGANYRHFSAHGFQTVVVSRSHLNNRSEKYSNNDESDPANLVLDYRSEEIENKVRFEHDWFKGSLRVNAGAGYEYVTYLNRTFNRVYNPGGVVTINYNTDIGIQKGSVFGQVSGKVLKDRMGWSVGLRTDFNDYSSKMVNPLKQLSPRASLSFQLLKNVALSANVGRYYQLPAYTILGYRANNEQLVNRAAGVEFIRCDHVVSGLQWTPTVLTKISVEGFYKLYSGYPFSVADSISLANLGGEFGVIGNEEVSSTSQGRAYGVELLAQQKLIKGWYGILAYTLVRSEFKDKNGEYVSSSWDFRHVVSLTGGKKFKKNWDVGVRWLLSGGAPYTPFDVATSSLISVWEITRAGLPDYNRLNEERLKAYHQLDIRVDKKWFLKKWSLNVYLDIQNIYGFAPQSAPFLNTVNDASGNPLVDTSNPSRYQTTLVDASSGTIVPTIGIIAEF
jgi:hypothetical protein